MYFLVITPDYPSVTDDVKASYIHQQVKALEQFGHTVAVWVMMPYRPKHLIRPKDSYVLDGIQVNVMYYPKAPGYYAFPFDARMMCVFAKRKMRKLLKNIKIDVVHGHTLITAHTVASIGHALQIPSFLTLHGQEDPQKIENTKIKRRALVFFLKYVTRIVLVGTPLIDYYKRVSGGRDNYEVIPNGINPVINVHPMEEYLLNQKGEHTIILSVCGLHQIKGIEYNLRAFSCLLNKGILGIRYWIVGDGPDRTRLEMIADECGILAYVKFWGRASNHDVPAFMRVADFFSLPSYTEAFGIVYLEAMMQSKPVIGCRGQGCEDIIENGVDGFLVPPHDERLLEDKMLELIQNKKLRENMGKKAQRKVLQYFTWDVCTTKLEYSYITSLGCTE
jgi:hypothetical protein